MDRQQVTGLVVNTKVNVPRNYIRQLKMNLYLWERYGYFKACELYLNDLKRNNPYANHPIFSRDVYLKMVKKVAYKSSKSKNDTKYNSKTIDFNSIYLNNEFLFPYELSKDSIGKDNMDLLSFDIENYANADMYTT